jgi:hypothetical protein
MNSKIKDKLLEMMQNYDGNDIVSHTVTIEMPKVFFDLIREIALTTNADLKKTDDINHILETFITNELKDICDDNASDYGYWEQDLGIVDETIASYAHAAKGF